MDDIVNSVPSGCLPRLSPYAFCLLLELFSPLYRRASAEQAFVRTGLSGQKW